MSAHDKFCVCAVLLFISSEASEIYLTGEMSGLLLRHSFAGTCTDKKVGDIEVLAQPWDSDRLQAVKRDTRIWRGDILDALGIVEPEAGRLGTFGQSIVARSVCPCQGLQQASILYIYINILEHHVL